MNLSVIGGGAWGSALYEAFSKKNDVVMSSRRQKEGFKQVDLQTALNAPFSIVAISAQSLHEWFKTGFIKTDTFLVIASKGIDAESGRFLDDIAREYVDEQNLAFLSGPSFAKEVRALLPTALTVFSKNESRSLAFAKTFPDFIKPYYSDDVIGGEIAGSYKNVIAIAAGICEGLKLGHNARAALISRGLVEIDRFGRYFGGRSETFLGLSGSGDLFLTANSELSRNFRVGLMLAQNKKVPDIIEELGEVAEGIMTTKAVTQIAKKHGLYTPIANEVAELLAGKEPIASLSKMLER